MATAHSNEQTDAAVSRTALADGPRLGLIGSPAAVERSLSPRMFAAAFAHLGVEGSYERLPLADASDLPDLLQRLRDEGFAGANVTIPHKEAVAEAVSSRSAAVQASGACNVLVVDALGGLHAHATDGEAVVASLQARGIACTGREITVLGAGGAAAQAAFACAASGAARIVVVNRTTARAEQLCKRLSAAFPALGLEVRAKLPIQHPAQVLVNAVPEEGMPTSGELQLDPTATVVDLAYSADSGSTRLVRLAAESGATVVDGLEILARQAALAFRHWFGSEGPFEVMHGSTRK